jgi:hypothetical protein
MIKERLIDFYQVFFTIGCDLHIYIWMDIAIFINQSILTDYDKNLYLDSESGS